MGPPRPGAAGTRGRGRPPAVIVGLLLLFPQTILALIRERLSVAPIASPAADPGPWGDYRNATADWISITVPFPDPAKPAASRVPAGLFDLVADLEPDLSATVGIRSQRHAVPPPTTRTDFELWLALVVDSDRWQYDLGSSWFVRVEPGISAGYGHVGSSWHGAFRAFSMGSLAHPLGPDDPVVASLGRELPAGAPDLALGPPYDTRLVIQDLGLFLKVRENHPIFEIGLFVHELAAVLTNRWWRTFGATNTLFGEGIRLDLDLDLAYVEGQGVVLNLHSGLDVTFDLDWTPLGDRDPSKRGFDLTIHSIRLVVPIEATEDEFNIRAELRFHASLRIGPVVIVIDGPGGWVGYWNEGTPPSKHYLGALPPTGAGIELTLPGVTGGGFLDFTGGPHTKIGGRGPPENPGAAGSPLRACPRTGSPGPSKIILLGSLRAQIPGPEELLRLRIDLVGLIDFQKKVIEFDATLINSHALGIFVLTGDAAFRSSYGDHPYVMLSIGGFHPHFNPEPAVFPELTR